MRSSLFPRLSAWQFRRNVINSSLLSRINVASCSASAKQQPDSVDKAVERARVKLEALNVPSLDRFVRIESKKIKKRALVSYVPDSFPKFIETVGDSFERGLPEVLQVNIGLTCNQTCHHCHVDSSPTRTEQMDLRTADQVLRFLRESPSIKVLDLTGGAPELIGVFRHFVESAREIRPDPLDLTIIVRCNLTVIFEENVPGFIHPSQKNAEETAKAKAKEQSAMIKDEQELIPNLELLDFYQRNKVKIIASLPCYSEANVDKQRGKGVFEKSIEGLQRLNEYGFGIEESGLELDLVYNPLGATLPPPREGLEQEYKQRLFKDFGIVFNNLHTFNNQPIKRFADQLLKDGHLMQYLRLLLDNFNVKSLETVMCRNTVNVGWTGHLYDCDFNQVLEMPMKGVLKREDDEQATGLGQFSEIDGPSIWDVKSAEDLVGQPIETCFHCYACTAGAGSKCGT